MRARFAWIREIGEPFTINDLARVSALVRFAAMRGLTGDDDLAAALLWRAAQRCWLSNASDTVRADVFAAANEMAVPADDPRRIAIAAYVGPGAHGYEVYEQLAAHATASDEDPLLRGSWAVPQMRSARLISASFG